MSGAFISIVLEKRLSEQLERAIREAVDLTQALAEVSEKMLANTRERFDAETSPLGVPWKMSARAAETGGKTLYKDGWLRRGLDRRSGATFAEVGVKPTGPQATYASIHQFGGTIRAQGSALRTPFGPRKSVTIPARPYLGFSEQDRTDITAILTDHLRDTFGEAA